MRIVGKLIVLFGIALVTTSCSNDDDEVSTPAVNAPDTYVFERNGTTSISFSGQTTRILMAEELIDAMNDASFTASQINGMFDHAEGDNDFSSAELNASDKSIAGKTAASFDFFAGSASAAVASDFESWITEQTSTVFPAVNNNTIASEGVAGNLEQLSGSVRKVNAKGIELNQVLGKSLIGALMADQMINNYISANVLNAFEQTNNDETLVNGKNYTNMEHDWDEAYGYLFGTASSVSNPLVDIGDELGGSDSFLNKYLDRVNDDPSFAGIAQEIYDALKLGRAAIVEKNYTVRNQQAEIIKEKVSEVIGVRAVYYLQSGKAKLEQSTVDYASAFHDLSEAYGFIYSLQFTRKPNSIDPYLTRTEVMSLINDLVGETNGLWDVTPETLDAISESIAAEFNFTVADAADNAN